MDLFSGSDDKPRSQLLADRFRPINLDDFVGQENLLGPGRLLRRLIEEDCLKAAVFFGPPGSGKTSLMRYIIRSTSLHAVAMSAVDSNTKRVKAAISLARHRLENDGKGTLLLIDEFHRFNRAQQEVLLPHIEEGLVGFLGLTTYNPYFSLAPALLSRTQLFEFKRLTPGEIEAVLLKALTNKEIGLGFQKIKPEPGALAFLAKFSGGDCRRALRSLELSLLTASAQADGTIEITASGLAETLQGPGAYARDGDDHYDNISALIKSIRGSDPDAAIYWLARMLEGGDEPRFIARRLVIAASEDIGNADPSALPVAMSAFQAVECVGMPEARINLAQTVTYLAAAPKSNASYLALEEAIKDIKAGKIQEVPPHLKSGGYPGASQLGRGEGYRYPHDDSRGWVEQRYTSVSKSYYRPLDRGYEAIIRKRLDSLSNKGEKMR